MAGLCSNKDDEIKSLREKIAQLEDQLDCLSLAASKVSDLEAKNRHLETLVETIRSENAALSKRISIISTPAAVENSVVEISDDCSAPFVVPGSWSGLECLATLKRCNQDMNVLCVRCHPFFPSLVSIGGASKCLVFMNVTSDGNSSHLYTYSFSAPIISMDFCPTHKGGLVSVGLMDGSIHLLLMCATCNTDKFGLFSSPSVQLGTLPTLAKDESSPSDLVRLVATFRDHSKYVVCTKWNRSGTLLANASHDKSVSLYGVTHSDDNMYGPEIKLISKFFFRNAVESVEFIKNRDGHETLVISVRGECYISYIDLHEMSFVQDKVSLNENSWDTHVSFSVLHLEASPDGKYLLASTDKGSAIVYRVGKNTHIRTLVGHFSDDYFQPRAVWTQDSKFIICNSKGSESLFVYCLASSKVIAKIKEHEGIVRDIYSHPSKRMIYTGSYDKSVKIFQY